MKTILVPLLTTLVDLVPGEFVIHQQYQKVSYCGFSLWILVPTKNTVLIDFVDFSASAQVALPV